MPQQASINCDKCTHEVHILCLLIQEDDYAQTCKCCMKHSSSPPEPHPAPKSEKSPSQPAASSAAKV
eukprot:3895868-Amphidinium_carterae.1